MRFEQRDPHGWLGQQSRKVYDNRVQVARANLSVEISVELVRRLLARAKVERVGLERPKLVLVPDRCLPGRALARQPSAYAPRQRKSMESSPPERGW